ncbi:helix-turn-helix domain-containing protein [Deinococcus sp. HMF7604]|uniref:helix-turn-helix domain-containing protein n=1 Tax=Deinococcus betulae TaxID=2873312 RepID=UPI001CCC4345|nr:helix-turn-helix domain-containing protein [Deinococcus betulae]MBZ9750757.1 helix-turn-helix domain-containing protein [Deinococcus betulae]
MDSLELLTVKQAAAEIMMSEQSIRRLAKTGKLASLNEDGQVLIKPESLEAYAAAQPHPPIYMCTLRACQQILGKSQRLKMYSPYKSGKLPVDSYEAHLERSRPHMEALISALKVKDYAAADQAREGMWRERIDYEMLYAPIEAGEVRQRPEKPDWATGLDDAPLN